MDRRKQRNEWNRVNVIPQEKWTIISESESKRNIPIHLVIFSNKYKLLESVSFTQTTLNNIEYYYLY